MLYSEEYSIFIYLLVTFAWHELLDGQEEQPLQPLLPFDLFLNILNRINAAIITIIQPIIYSIEALFPSNTFPITFTSKATIQANKN